MTVLEKIKAFNFEDLECVCKLIIAFLPAMILKLFRPHIWLVAERPMYADDNGIHFYRWLRKNHPKRAVFFLMSKKSVQYDKNDDHYIDWMSLKHYIYYIAADCLVNTMYRSTQPSNRVMNYYNQLFTRERMVYLGHGIHKDGCEMYKYDVQHFRLLVCTLNPEFEYFKKNAGYPDGYIIKNGMARYDDLIDKVRNDGFILIIPTWRRYVGANDGLSYEKNEKLFMESAFYQHYISLINNEELIAFLQETGLKAKFCLHAHYKQFTHLFQSKSNLVEIAKESESIHEMLMFNNLLITDYSSVFFDAAYAGKPVIYYHFDIDEYRESHFSEGFFSYERDGLGPIVKTEVELVRKIKKLYDGNNFVWQKEYTERFHAMFGERTRNNNENLYKQITKVFK